MGSGPRRAGCGSAVAEASEVAGEVAAAVVAGVEAAAAGCDGRHADRGNDIRLRGPPGWQTVSRPAFFRRRTVLTEKPIWRAKSVMSKCVSAPTPWLGDPRSGCTSM